MTKEERKNELSRAREAVKKAGLYPAQKSDIRALSEVAADAYRDYPLHNWFSGGSYDEKASELILSMSLRSMLDGAVIYADSDELNGFAIWLPSGFTGSKTVPFLVSGGIKLIFHSGPGIVGRLLTYENFAMKLKKELTGHNDWYLYNLSIKTSAQGKGIASKLLRPMLELCDNEKTTAYLETNKEKNVGLYEHFGFELKKEEKIPGSDVTHYAMVREAFARNG